MIKAAFFDIDGTLLSFRTHKVSDGTVRAFARLRQAGVHTFISSGRPRVLFPDMPLAFDGYVTMNGALTMVGDTILVSNPISGTSLDAWLDFALKHNICTMMFTADGMMLAQPNEAGLKLRQQLEFTMPPVVGIDDMRGRTAYQLIALMPAEVDAKVAAFMPDCRLPRWHPAFTDIVSATNSKAVGMDAICRHFGIGRDETIAFGDGANDLEMLEWAGIGIAMGNAADLVKQHADMVTASVDDEGIEKAIKTLAVGHWPLAANSQKPKANDPKPPSNPVTQSPQLAEAMAMLRNYEELAVEQVDDDSFVARGNGFCDRKYSDDFIEMQIAKLKAQITELQSNPETLAVGRQKPTANNQQPKVTQQHSNPVTQQPDHAV